MASALEPCILCDFVHRGSCESFAKKTLPKRTPKAQALPKVKTPELLAHVDKLTEAGTEPKVELGTLVLPVNRWATVTTFKPDVLKEALAALTPILHESEILKHGLRIPVRSNINQRIRKFHADRERFFKGRG